MSLTFTLRHEGRLIRAVSPSPVTAKLKTASHENLGSQPAPTTVCLLNEVHIEISVHCFG